MSLEIPSSKSDVREYAHAPTPWRIVQTDVWKDTMVQDANGDHIFEVKTAFKSRDQVLATMRLLFAAPRMKELLQEIATGNAVDAHKSATFLLAEIEGV